MKHAEATNANRAAWANDAIQSFQHSTGTDIEDALADLLADLLHWADHFGQDFDREMARGRGHYTEEIIEEAGR
jgi:hypothetical protein